jgi:hypothetical protein
LNFILEKRTNNLARTLNERADAKIAGSAEVADKDVEEVYVLMLPPLDLLD